MSTRRCTVVHRRRGLTLRCHPDDAYRTPKEDARDPDEDTHLGSATALAGCIRPGDGRLLGWWWAAASVTPPPDAAASIEANNLKFSTAEVAVPAGAPFRLFFRNLEGAPHNVAIYKESTASEKIFVGETITNAALTYDVPAIPAGEYFFRCDVHTDMTGTLRAS